MLGHSRYGYDKEEITAGAQTVVANTFKFPAMVLVEMPKGILHIKELYSGNYFVDAGVDERIKQQVLMNASNSRC